MVFARSPTRRSFPEPISRWWRAPWPMRTTWSRSTLSVPEAAGGVFGDCAVTGNVTAMRNLLAIRSRCSSGSTSTGRSAGGRSARRSGDSPHRRLEGPAAAPGDPGRRVPPGCPPDADRIRRVVEALLDGRSRRMVAGHPVRVRKVQRGPTMIDPVSWIEGHAKITSARRRGAVTDARSTSPSSGDSGDLQGRPVS